MRPQIIARLILLVGTFVLPSIAIAEDEKEQEKKCYINYEGDHTVVIVCEDEITIKTDRDHLKDMVRIEDVTKKNPFGGPRSLPNETIDKVAKKPAKWLKKRLGF